MAEKIGIKAQHLSEIDLSPYGQVLDYDSSEQKIYPHDNVIVTPDIGHLEIKTGVLDLMHLRVTRREFAGTMLERHLLTSQTFIPLLGSCGLFLLAPPEDLENKNSLPDLDKVVAVIFDGTKGVNLKVGTWHCSPFALSEMSNYIMVSRAGTLKDDLHLVDLPKQMNRYFEIVL
ncbi:MAG: ureidoglycolate lyase [Thermodesulfobacteriota bacterium]|nr:ureidoglycolate lyase [Thermodesulfobacteriota bacterium]